ncbi:Zinc finger CCHC domain-containing protein 12, partial [Bienertia sinuspersici]
SIDKACRDLWPEVGRRYCTKHLSVNFKKAFPGPKMFQLFWLASGAYNDFTFKKAMEQIDKYKAGARVWLANLGDQNRWSKHKFNPSLKCDVNKTNFVESFNATLGIDRCRPVLTLLEGIRRVTMVRMATRRQLCDKWERSDVCPNIVKRVQYLCNESRTCLAYLSGQGERRGEEEQKKGKRSNTLRCSNCGDFGHNKLTCQNGPTKKQAKGKQAEGITTVKNKAA